MVKRRTARKAFGMRTTLSQMKNQGVLLCAGLFIFTMGCQQVGGKRLPPNTPPLHRAAAEDDIDAMSRLMENQLETTGSYGWTPLHFAAIFNAPRAARLLLDRGAYINPLDHMGMTPLHWAARKGNEQIVDLFLGRRAEVMARNAFDMTPLHEASTVGIARMLLERGAQMMATDIDGMTPLHTAPTRSVAQFLIGKGADVNARAKDGRTPMDMPPTPRPRLR
jgi:ankyrin repeat protein